MIFCKHGCGQLASYQDRCDRSSNRCPAVKSKNSMGLKAAWKTRKPVYENLPEETKKRMAWSKGLTRKSDPRIEGQARQIRGRRRISDPELLRLTKYREDCKFDLKGCVENVLGYPLLKERGMFHKTENRDGVVRDHRLSVKEGYSKGISPEIMRHPANCRFVLATENARKTFLSELSIQELLEDIHKWNKENASVVE